MKIARYFDAAILKPDMTPEQVADAIKEAISFDSYTVCVRGCDIDLAVKMTEGTNTKVSCVLDFPYGYGGLEAKRADARAYAAKGVEDIDMVMNYGAARGGAWDVVEAEIKAVVEEAHAKGVNVKVIFETSQLTVEQIKKATEVSIAAGAGHYFVENTQMERVAKACSYVQLMTYDLRSGFEREAGHHTNLFPTPGDRLNGSVQASVEDFAAAGVPKDKIVIGAAFYSRRWDGVPDVNHGLFQTAATTGQYGPGYTDLYDEYINKNGFVRYWDDAAKAPYLFNGSTFISYDDPESIRLKCAYLKKEGLLGIMYWEHSCDPSRRLLTAMADAMLHA